MHVRTYAHTHKQAMKLAYWEISNQYLLVQRSKEVKTPVLTGQEPGKPEAVSQDYGDIWRGETAPSQPAWGLSFKAVA